MSYQYNWSAKFSDLERYKGFFPSYADDPFDISTDCSTGETSDRCVDFVEANSHAKDSSSFVGPAYRKAKQSGKACQERDGEGNGGSCSSSSSGASSVGGGGAHGLSDGARRRVRRKAKTPRRSARKNDPRFRGVTFCVETKLCREKRQRSKLCIRSFYSMMKSPSDENHHEQTRNKRRNISVVSTTSGSETETTVNAPLPQHIAIPFLGAGLGGKQCASCCTRRTPLWRDAEDGTPLCNACGIRYKKYRIRCVSCWNIPKKDGKSSCQVCSRCGNMLRITIPKRSYLC